VTKQPRVTARQTLRALRRLGWEPVHQVGSHIQLKHRSHPGRVTVPNHAREILAPGTLSSILSQASVSLEEFMDVL
jgi:predicted RNA binding protein YcfA (HicA-like mRNA interferase family)